MKNTLATIFLCSLITSHAFASDFVEINLTKMARLSSMEFSLFGSCGDSECKGAELVVPTGARVAVEPKQNASCAIQRSAALVYKGGDSYIVTAQLKLNSNQSCNVMISTRSQGKATIQLVNVQAGLPRLTGSN